MQSYVLTLKLDDPTKLDQLKSERMGEPNRIAAKAEKNVGVTSQTFSDSQRTTGSYNAERKRKDEKTQLGVFCAARTQRKFGEGSTSGVLDYN